MILLFGGLLDRPPPSFIEIRPTQETDRRGTHGSRQPVVMGIPYDVNFKRPNWDVALQDTGMSSMPELADIDVGVSRSDPDIIQAGYWEKLERRLAGDHLGPEDDGPDPDPLF